MEEWKDIEGYEGLYQVSTLGRVRSLPRKNARGQQLKGRYLKPGPTTDGYLSVRPFKDGKGRSILVHRLVAQAFIPNPYNKPVVNHKNEVKTDNRIENLEWATIEYNVNYGTRTKRATESRVGQCLSEACIEKIRSAIKEWHRNNPSPVRRKIMCVETGEVFDSIKQAKERTRITTISHALRGYRPTAGGYHWRYA